jgi:S1-C subfamily serine protease
MRTLFPHGRGILGGENGEMQSRASMAAVLFLLFAAAFAEGEVRTWKAAAGAFTADAEFVELKPGDVVRLRTKDGRELNVPLAQLSAADQTYVRARATNSPLSKARRAADLCRFPDDAIVVWKVFHDDPQTVAEDRAVAAAKIAELKDLAAQKMVRLNKKWVTAAEADVVRKKADELMRQGVELIKLGQENAFRRKFAEAAALEPETIRADFLTGLIFTLLRQSDKALPCYQKCLLIDPDNVAALNNVALTSAAKGDWGAAAAAWRKALTLQPDQRVVHNVGRFLEQSLRANVSGSQSARDGLALAYAELVASGKFEATDETVGWLLLLIEQSDLDLHFGKEGNEENRPSPKPPATEDGPVVGGGTGFVVHPGYVLTNAHVAAADGTFEVQLPDGRLLRAERTAVDEQADLALLKVDELTAPPLRLAPYAVARGTDVMLLGYPEMFTLGASLKAMRGSISSIPDPNFKNRYLYDAVTNSGNSGGPVCDDKANVVAVHAVGINTAGRYGGGIPSAEVLAFVRRSLPDFKPAEPYDQKLDWPQVDERVSPSTLLIWVRKKNGKTLTAMGADVIEVPICLFCGGARLVACRSCRSGTIVRDGQPTVCQLCGGDGKVNCGVCNGAGVDVKLASVKAALGRGSTSKTTPVAVRPATGSPKPVVNLVGEAPGANGLGYDMRVRLAPNVKLDDAEIVMQMAALEGTDSRAALNAAKRLAEALPDPRFRDRVADRLERWLHANANWQAHAACIRALETWTGPNSVASISRSTRNFNWIVRHQSAYALAFLGDPDGISALLHRLRLPDDVESRTSEFDPAAERRLWKTALILFGPAARPEVEKHRNDPDQGVRAAVEEILKAYAELQPGGDAAPKQNAVPAEGVGGGR